jgi:hypothetical protein
MAHPHGGLVFVLDGLPGPLLRSRAGCAKKVFDLVPVGWLVSFLDSEKI